MKKLLTALLSAGFAFSALTTFAEGPKGFYEQNLAACFYCGGDTSITPGDAISDNGTLQKAVLHAIRDDAYKAEPAEVAARKAAIAKMTDKELVVQENAPTPFKDLIRAYEGGDLQDAYKKAVDWVAYQDRVLKRTDHLTALVSKARAEINADKKVEDATKSILAAITGESSIDDQGNKFELYLVLDINNRAHDNAASAGEELFKRTMFAHNMTFTALSAKHEGIEEISDFRSRSGFSAPLRIAANMVNDFELNGLPALVAKDAFGRICKIENISTTTGEELHNNLKECKFK